MTLNDFFLFALASLMLNITPGSDMLYVATRSTGQGTKAGILSALGITTGCLVHVAAAVAGLSAILSSSPMAFTLVKFLGAGYLLYLGIKSFINRNAFTIIASTEKISNEKIFWQGALTNVLNPKVALFFLAFLPQFIQPTHPKASLYIFSLGLWFTFSGAIVNILVAILFGKMGNWLANKPWFTYWQNKITGTMLLALALKLALTKNDHVN